MSYVRSSLGAPMSEYAVKQAMAQAVSQTKSGTSKRGLPTLRQVVRNVQRRGVQRRMGLSGVTSSPRGPRVSLFSLGGAESCDPGETWYPNMQVKWDDGTWGHVGQCMKPDAAKACLSSGGCRDGGGVSLLLPVGLAAGAAALLFLSRKR